MATLVPVTELRPDKQGRESRRPREPRPRSHTSMLAATGWQMKWLTFCHSFWTLRQCRYNFSATQIPKKHRGSVRSESAKAECSRWSKSLLWVVVFPFFKAKFLSQSTGQFRRAPHGDGWGLSKQSLSTLHLRAGGSSQCRDYLK